MYYQSQAASRCIPLHPAASRFLNEAGERHRPKLVSQALGLKCDRVAGWLAH